MVTLWRCRAVDAAAAQLIVRESGGLISFTAYEDPLAAPLDVRPHSPVIAARTPDSLALLRQVPIPD
jgi:myo-inositol-1(or 4)-monophosphatase